MNYNIGVDIGGTFTDCVVVDEAGELTIGKALSTPDNFADGVVNAVRHAAKNIGLDDEEALLRSTSLFFHGCTVGDNALLTHSGAKTALITTKGFADTILMMRGRITEGLTETEASHFYALRKPEPLIPRLLIGEITQRTDYKGAVVVDLDEEEVINVVDHLVSLGAEAIAISLLWSISNDAHEKTIESAIKLRHPSMFLSLSSEVAPFLGEYERSITTVLNAYIGPTILSYLSSLRDFLREKGLKKDPLVMQAYGGVLAIEECVRRGVGLIESGPAAGVVGSQYFGARIGQPNILVTDMGGTTFKVSLVRDGKIEKNYSPVILRHPVLATKIWVESIGAGGGSIGWIDQEKGLLKVGPQGAGAKPGPVCYDLGGTEPTVADADLILGYLNENYFLGGRMKLNKQAAIDAVELKIAKPLQMSLIEAASGIYRITNAHMADLMRRATVERGYDPRDFVLFVTGGAAPVHCGRYAAELGIKEVIIPSTSAVHGGLGLLASDVVFEYGKAARFLFPPDVSVVNHHFTLLMKRAVQDLNKMGFREQEIVIVRSVDMRYRFQSHELNVDLAPGASEITTSALEQLDSTFDEMYEKSYGPGSGYRAAGKEITAFRLRAVGNIQRPNIKRYELSKAAPESAIKETRDVYFEEPASFMRTPIYDFAKIKPGMKIKGPGIIESTVTTIVVNPRDVAAVDEFQDVRLYINAS
jgi:N-methylhydantoinase A